MEKLILGGGAGSVKPTCLRFATVYGVGRRMRFDLTVNEFTRELWADRELEVFGEQFWRPYIHVRDAGRAVRTVLEAPEEKVAGNVFNAGRSGENYRKLDLVEEIGKQIDRGSVSYVKRDEDPRDYKVSFDKIRAELGFETLMTVPDGIAEIITALDAESVRRPVRPALQEHSLSVTSAPDRTDGQHRDLPRAAAVRPAAAAAGPRGGGRDAALGLADARSAHGRVRGGVRGASRRAPRDRRLQLHRGAAPRLPRRTGRPRRRGDRARVHVRRDRRRCALLRRHAGVRGDRLAQGSEPRPR